MVPWIKKYQPKDSAEIPQPTAMKQIRSYVADYSSKSKKAMLLHGPTGSCKTTTVHTLANEYEMEVLELNASEFRKAEQVNQKVGNAIKQASLFYSSKIILIDEVDCLSGVKDRGGLAALSKLIDISKYPILMTANDAYDPKLSTIRKKSSLVEFRGLNYLSIYNVLKTICEKESVAFDENSLKTIARSAGGDLRAAINDIQTLSRINNRIDSTVLDNLGERLRIESMPTALVKVFKNSDPKIALRAFDNVKENLEKCMLWVDENLPNEYTKPEDLKRAYECLSRAAVFRGRIRRWQYWRFLVYVNTLTTAGIATAKTEKYKKFLKYTPTKRILKLWIANMKYKKRKAIAEKIAETMHCSTKRAVQDILPYVKIMFKNKAEELTEYFELEKEEADWLRK